MKMKNFRLSCEDVEILMQDYLDGYLLSSQRQSLEEHLSVCPECRDELVRMKKLEEKLEGNIPVEVPSSLEESIVNSLPKRAMTPYWAGRMVRIGGLGITTFIVFILVGLLAYSPYNRKEPGNREVEIVFHSPDAKSVNVAGDFNEWNMSDHMMVRDSGGTWRLTIYIEPGLYQYNFYIDHDHWAENLEMPTYVSDGFGGRNALLYIEG